MKITMPLPHPEEQKLPNCEEQKAREKQTRQQKSRLNQAPTSVFTLSLRPSLRSEKQPPKAPNPPRDLEFNGAGSLPLSTSFLAAPTQIRRTPAPLKTHDHQAPDTTRDKNQPAATAAETAAGEEAGRKVTPPAMAPTQNKASSTINSTKEKDMTTITNIKENNMTNDKTISRTTRTTQSELTALLARMSARDMAVLDAISKYRFLTSEQIGRLFMADSTSKASQTRKRNLLLQRLSQDRLIAPLERRVGGFGGGSSVKVWHITEPGQRLLTLNMPGEHPRRRFQEPSAMFLNHTLAVAECAVQLITLTRESYDINLVQLDTEPTCWRKFEDRDQVSVLKPDMFAITNYDDYEDRWFIEMDLGSESIPEIIEKCNVYLRYYYSGIEQKETKMFPLVVWIVKNHERKAAFDSEFSFHFRAQPKMFLVIEAGDLEKLLRMDIDMKQLNGGMAGQDEQDKQDTEDTKDKYEAKEVA